MTIDSHIFKAGGPMRRIEATRLWYAIHTRSNFEQRIASELSLKGIDNFLPAYQEVHQWKQRKKVIAVPLFPGYVFVSLDNSPAARLTVLQTTGVVRILGNANESEPVPHEELEALRRIVESGQRCYSHPFLREGMRVRIRRGVLKGFEGTLSRFKNKMRVVTSVTLLCQSAAVEVDAHDLEMVWESCIRT
jgi:transcription antitermination factor NusG